MPLALVLFSGLLYANSARNGFTLDDRHLVAQNPLIRSLANVPILFRSDYWEPKVRSGLYRPLVTLSYALNYRFAGSDPAPYHRLNILLHAANGLLVLLLFRRLGVGEPVAAAGAGLFAAHAIHTEAVANVAGRSELLAAFFLLAAFLFYVEAQARARSVPAYVASVAAYLAALLCKENAITFLGVVLLHDVLFATPSQHGIGARLVQVLRGKRLRFYGGILVVTALYLVIRSGLLSAGEPVQAIAQLDNPLVGLSFGWRIFNAVQVAFRYLGLLIFPLHLSYDYSYNQIPLIRSLLDLRVLGVLVGSAILVAMLIWSYRSSKAMCFALGLAGVTFSIVSNLVLPIGTILGERLLYLPSVGFCLAVALTGRALCARLPFPRPTQLAVFVVGIGLIVGGNGWRSVVRNGDWASDEVLMLSALAGTPGSAKVQSNAGGVFLDQRRYAEAIEHLETAIGIDPDFASPHIHLGHVFLELGREEEAMAAYEGVLARGWADGQTYNNLGYLLVEREVDLVRGVRLIENAVREAPKNPNFLDSLGWAYFKLGRTREAYDLIARSLEIDDTGASGARRRAHLDEVRRALGGRAAPGTP